MSNIKELPKRKHLRLKEYDYSQSGCYFITICVKGHKCLLCDITVGRDAHIPPQIIKTKPGETTDKYIQNIDKAYDNINVDKYCIMPNHIHLLLSINENGGVWAPRPTINTVVRSLKTMVSKEMGYSVWQESFFDEIIRNQEHCDCTWNYIECNPYKWLDDELFIH